MKTGYQTVAVTELSHQDLQTLMQRGLQLRSETAWYGVNALKLRLQRLLQVSRPTPAKPYSAHQI